VLAFALGGLVFVVYRALRVEGPFPCVSLGGTVGTCMVPTSPRWDLVAGAAAVVVALVVVAALWCERSIRR
jgi:hypothetical protein